jgi:predicted DCC family thiol-disulfide oxidoreductase YuxK
MSRIQCPAADWLYDRVARNRYAIFGKKPVCMTPRADIRARFLG